MVQKTNIIPLARPFILDESITGAIEVLKSGNLVQGHYVRLLEEELRKYLNIKHAILLSSGTAALYSTLLALNIGPGDEVIIPAFTFIATANVVEAVGAKPVLVDISANDFNIDAELISKAITPKTKAIMPVHEFGQAARMDKITAIAKEKNLIIVEDAACALGTIYQGTKVGTNGIVGCFSFHPRKIITTGEGGLVVTNDDFLAAKIRAFRNHGIEKTAGGKMDLYSWGLNLRMTDIQAAIGLPQLPVLDNYLKNRTKLAGYYNYGLEKADGINTPFYIKDGSHTYQTYHVLLDEKFNRDAIIESLKSRQIETNLGAQAIHMLSFYRKKYGYKTDDFPNAARAYKSGLALPIGHHVNKDDLDYISIQLQDVLNT
jgi:perosamine synthetase